MVIKRIDPLSAAKISAVLYAGFGLLFGALFSVFAMAGLAAGGQEGFAAALFGVGAVVVLPVFYGVVGALTTLVAAWLFNVVAGIVGGVVIDVE